MQLVKLVTKIAALGLLCQVHFGCQTVFCAGYPAAASPVSSEWLLEIAPKIVRKDHSCEEFDSVSWIRNRHSCRLEKAQGESKDNERDEKREFATFPSPDYPRELVRDDRGER